MKRILYKNDPSYNTEMAKSYTYTFSVKDYTYFFTREEWNSIPTINSQPHFNPETEYLVLIEKEVNGEVVREWTVDTIPPIITHPPI